MKAIGPLLALVDTRLCYYLLRKSTVAFKNEHLKPKTLFLIATDQCLIQISGLLVQLSGMPCSLIRVLGFGVRHKAG